MMISGGINAFLWRSLEPSKRVGLKPVVDKDVADLHLKPSDAMDH